MCAFTMTRLPRLILAAVLFWAAALACAQVAVPPLKARVTDLTATLDAGRMSALEAKLAEFEKRKGSQIAVLLTPTTAPETIEQYGIRVAEQWKVGRKGVDDGAILLIAIKDKALRIEVGRGLEGVIPDAIAKRIIDEHIVPRFKKGEFADGIDVGVERMIKLVDGEPLPPPARGRASSGQFEENMGWAALLLMIFSGLLRWLLGAFLGGVIVGAAAGAVALWMGATMIMAGVIGVIAFVVTLLGITNVGRVIGGGSGGGSWGGGGGGFGGGGASGRW
jgi:uncharacterized protein